MKWEPFAKCYIFYILGLFFISGLDFFTYLFKQKTQPNDISIGWNLWHSLHFCLGVIMAVVLIRIYSKQKELTRYYVMAAATLVVASVASYFLFIFCYFQIMRIQYF